LSSSGRHGIGSYVRKADLDAQNLTEKDLQEYEAERVELLKLAPVSGCMMVTRKTYLLYKQQKDKQRKTENWDATASFKLESTPTRKSDFLHVQKYYAIPDEFKVGKQLSEILEEKPN
jgi:hypothetical protein